jgi:hypothetical protein
VFPIPGQLGHEGVLFALQVRGNVGVRRVAALDDDGDEIAGIDVPGSDAGEAC